MTAENEASSEECWQGILLKTWFYYRIVAENVNKFIIVKKSCMDEYLPLAQQVKILFDAVRREDGQPFTLQEVSDATGISLGTVGQMRSGKISNPQLNTLRALCRFFRVPLRYFETQTAEECYALLTVQSPQAQPALNEIAFRASGLSEDAQQDILALIKMFKEEEKRQGSNDDPTDDTSGNANSDAR